MLIQFLWTHCSTPWNVFEYILLALCKKYRWVFPEKKSETDRKMEYAKESSSFNWP